MVISNDNAAVAISAGKIAVIPAVAYGGNEGTAEGTTLTSALMIPGAIDDEGTISLVIHAAPENASLVSIAAAALPAELRFIAGDNEILYLTPTERMRNTVQLTGKSNLKVEIPYVRGKKPDVPRQLRLIDAAGKAFQNVKVSLELYVGSYPHPIVPLNVDTDGYFTLPTPINRLIEGHQIPWDPNQNLGRLKIKELVHGQVFETHLKNPYDKFPEVIQIPFADEANASELTSYTIRLVNSDGSPASETRVHFSYYRNSDQPDVEATETLREASPGKDGQLRLMVSPDMQIASPKTKVISGSIYEEGNPSQMLFQGAGEISLKPGTNPDFVLARRLTLDAQLVSADGKPVQFTSTSFMAQQNLAITRLTSDTVRPNHPSFIHISGSRNLVFTMPGLPVPGSYIISAFGKEFGPVGISETSPTELVKFKEAALDGKFVGQVLDEKGQPLAGALVVASKTSMKLKDVASVEPLIDRLKGMSEEEGKIALYNLTSGTYGFSITDATGRYAIARELRQHSPMSATFHWESIYLLAAAPNRFPAYLNGLSSTYQPQSLDVEIKPVRLPAFAYYTGAVEVPAEISDDSNPGAMIPVPAQEAYYTVGLSGPDYWFSSPPWTQSTWRYDGGSETFPIGSPFKIKVPAGTTFTLAASSKDLHLSTHTWHTSKTLEAGEIAELPIAQLQALNPYYLKVLDKEGIRLPGYSFHTRYTNMSKTDARGVALCYYKKGEPERIYVFPPGDAVREPFLVEPVDDGSTSIPVVTIRLSKAKTELEATR